MDRSPQDEVAGGDGGEEQQGPRGQRRQERERRRQEAQRQAQDQDSEDDSDTELLKSMANLVKGVRYIYIYVAVVLELVINVFIIT